MNPSNIVDLYIYIYIYIYIYKVIWKADVDNEIRVVGCSQAEDYKT